MLCTCLETCVPVLLPYGIKVERHQKLTWEEIQPYGNDGVMYVTTRMQKTKDIVHNCKANGQSLMKM